MTIKPVQLVALSILLIVILLVAAAAVEAKTFKKPVSKKAVETEQQKTAAEKKAGQEVPKLMDCGSGICSQQKISPLTALQAYSGPQPAARIPQASSTDLTVVTLNTNDAKKTKEAVEYIRNNGGVVSIVYIPNTLVTLKLPSNLDSALQTKYGAKIYRGITDPKSIPNVPPALMNALSVKPRAEPGVPLERREFKEEVRMHPLTKSRATPAGSSGLPPGANYAREGGGSSWGPNTSAYMLGDVFVSVILPESNGAINPNIEDWNSTEETNIDAATAAALNWWVNRSIDYGASYKLTFWTYPQHYKIPVSYEPAHYDSEVEWTGEIMDALGVPANSQGQYARLEDYTSSLRNTKGLKTDWALVVKFVDSSASSITNLRTSATLGGPDELIIYEKRLIPAPNEADVLDLADSVAHETGHVFWALDEYGGSMNCKNSSSCTLKSGILQVENQNCVYCTGTGVESIMGGDMFAFQNGALDQYAAGQIGWRDKNTNLVTDSLDADYNTYDSALDTDADKIINYWDIDDDNDGITDDMDACRFSAGFAPGFNGCSPPFLTVNAGQDSVELGEAIKISATATDNFKITDVSLYLGNVKTPWTCTGLDTAAANCYVDLTFDKGGIHNYYAIAKDDVNETRDPQFSAFSFKVVSQPLAIEKTGTGSGKIKSEDGKVNCITNCNTEFKTGAIVTLTATPANDGSIFTGWGGACSSGRSTACTLTMDAAKSVTANFDGPAGTHSLAIEKLGKGKGYILSDPSGINCNDSGDCSFNFKKGWWLTLYPAVEKGSVFDGWSSCSGKGPCTVIVDSAKTVTAKFSPAPPTNKLTVTRSGPGVVSSDKDREALEGAVNCGAATCTAAYKNLTTVTLYATPDKGAAFTGWGGSCSGTRPSCTIPAMDGDKTVTASFK